MTAYVIIETEVTDPEQYGVTCVQLVPQFGLPAQFEQPAER